VLSVFSGLAKAVLAVFANFDQVIERLGSIHIFFGLLTVETQESVFLRLFAMG